MSVPRRFNRPQGLKDIDVLIEDDAPISIYFNVVEVPEVITQGKSSFLIGGSNLLKPEVEIKFEITNDNSGAVIYTEPISNYLEGTSRRVSIEVYDDVDLFGDATLTIIGELNPQQTNVPSEFIDTYNVRYTRKIYISSAGVNTQPILFYNQPRIIINEIVKPYITTTVPTDTVTKTGGATGEPIPEDIGKSTNVKELEEPSKFIKTQKNKLNNKLFGGGGNNAFVRRGRRRARRASPEIDKFTITQKSGDKFDARFVGGEIQIPNPQVDTNKFTLESFHEVPTLYKSDVENVKNEDTLVPEKPFTIIDTRFPEDDPQRNVIVPLATENLTYTASMESVPTQSISTVNFRSYADIRLSRLRTFSGDIDRVKVYARNKDAFGDFEIVSDQQIESPELLFNVFGAGNQRLGYFLTQDHVNLYWVSSSNSVITQDSSYLLNSVQISGSNRDVNEFVTFEQTGSLPINFTKDTEYNVTFNALGFKGDKNTIGGSERSGRLGIFLSGSGFYVNHNHGDELGYQLEINNQPAFLNVTFGEQQDFGEISETFSPQLNGGGVLKLVVFSGNFYVSDISITPATATGFSPNFVQIIAPVPPLTQERPDDYEFIAEFYDVNNNVAEAIVFASSSTFVGGNNYIAGGDNLLSGSMFIGSSIGGGIEMAGVNSGFIRSIGYEGFTSASNPSLGSPGFLMFSGSVLPNSGDNYKGVGLELVGSGTSFFKFRTDPSELDIRTDAFFIGQESIQFMSGSDGNIEISSSLFHLDPKNERLIIGADATINADLTVNNVRTPATIGGSASTILNASSSITSQGFARFVSASIGGFDVDETTITSTDDSLILKSSGQITGSSTLIGNKSAGQFLQFKGSTLTVQGDITANNIRTPASIGGSPSTDVNASSSIDSQGFASFKSASIGGFVVNNSQINSSNNNLILKSTGEITASAVSMSGTITADAGRIAGWRIEGDVLSGSNATLDAAGAALYKSDQGPGSDTTAAFDRLRNEYYIDFTPTGLNSSNFFIKMGPNFGVDKDGILFASGAAFEGAITASKGLIGGFTIGSSSLFSSNIFISGSPETGGTDDPKNMFISTSNFNVKENGDVTGSQVLFDGGKIGGFTLSEGGFSLGTNNINLDSTNKKITINDSTFGNQGIQLDFNNGTPRFYVGDGTNEFLKFDGSSIDIRTKQAFISGSKITLKSPDFFLGDTNNFISGSGGQLAIQALGTTTISGSAVNIQTPKFFMGGVNQFVSGSNGNIEISSSNFHLESTGDVTMAGTITATAGQIGGFGISSNSISSSNDNLILLSSGQITGSQVLFDGGTIGGFTIDADEIKSGTNIGLNSATKAITINNTTFGNQGIQLEYNSGTPRFYVGDGTNEFLKFDGSSIDIRTKKAFISGSQITLKSPDFFLGDTNNFISGSGGNLAIQATGTTTISGSAVNIQTPKFFMGGQSQFVSGSNGNIEISSSNFHLEPAGNVTMAGTITATAGQIGGFGISSNSISSSNNALIFLSSGQITASSAKLNGSDVDIDVEKFELDASNLELSSTHASMSLGEGKLILQGASTSTIKVADKFIISSDGTDEFLAIGNKTSFTHFDQSTAGIIMGMHDTTTKFEVVGNASNYLSFDGTNFDVKLSQGLELDASNIELSSTHASMSIGNTNPIILQSIGSDRVLRFGSKTDFGQTTTAGFIMGIDNGVPKLDFTVGTSNDNFFRIDASGVDFSSDTITINTDRFKITSTAGNERIRFFSGSNSDTGRVTGAGEFVRIGEVSDDSSDLYGLKIYDGTGTGSADTLVKLGQDGNEIAGWTITQDRLSGGQMIIRSDGTIESSGFATDVAGSGFRLSAENGGFLEVENAKIRGTMATTVFEKESVNAVGGQLYVANSTTLTGSSFPTSLAGSGRTAGNYPANETTMSVENVTGFVQGEILSLKKVTDSGFSTEYVFVNSASRQDSSSDTDFSGQLYVTRGYGSGVSGDSGSLGDQPSSAQVYSGSQVIVSTGRYISGDAPNTVGSGYIRMNANPADSATPYMDIIERTGSGIYDVELKARLGDLSGLSSGLLFGETNPGFGLFTENVFLKGAITAVTGSITGKLFVDTSSSQKMIFGIGVDGGSSDGIFINANNYWYTNGAFKVGSATYNLQNDASGNISINPKTFELDATNIEVSSTHASMSLGEGKIKLVGASTSTITVGSSNSITISDDGTDRFVTVGKSNFSQFDQSTEGIIFGTDNGHAKFEVAADSSNYISFDGQANTLDIKASQFNLTGTSGLISLGTLANADDVGDTSTGFRVDSSGNTLIKQGTANTGYIRFASGSVVMKTSDFFLGDATNHLSGSNGNLNIKSINFELDASDIELSSTHASMSLGSNVKMIGSSGGSIGLGSTVPSNLLSDGIFLSGSGEFNLQGDSSNFLRRSGTTLEIKTATFGLDAGSLIISSSMDSGNGVIRLGASGGPSSPTADVAGIYMDGGGALNVYGDASNFLRFDGGSVDIRTDEILIQTAGTNKLKLSADGTNTPTFAMGATLNTSVAGTNKGMFMNGEGDFLLRGNANNFFKFDASGNSIEIASDTFDLDTSTLVMKSESTGSIALGASPPTTYESGTGFFVDGAGNLLVGSTSGNFIQFGASSGALTLKSQVFSLFTSTIVIDSSTNNGKIALGATPPPAYNNGTGVYMDGTGKFLAGAHNGNRIQFDGTNVDIIAETFFIGTTNTQFISGSDSNIEISSSLFHLDPKNNSLVIGANATINADLTANNIRTPATIGGSASTVLNASSSISSDGFAIFKSASIGGFDVTETQISSTNNNIVLQSNGSTTISGSSVDIQTPSFFLGATGSAFVSGSDGKMQISSSNFHLEPAGNVTVKGQITADSGRIGGSAGWKIGTQLIQGVKGATENIRIDGGTGNMMINGDTAYAVTFGDTDTQDIDLDSNTSLPIIMATRDDRSRSLFRVGDANQFIKFDTGATPKLFISSSNYFLGGSSQFISGSNGNIEVSSSNFHLDNTGNVVMSGNVTATTGNIGGFLISQNEISSSATAKRGLVLKPGDAIRGFGNSAHSSRGTGGKFSFGAGQSIAPAAGAALPTFDPTQNQDFGTGITD